MRRLLSVLGAALVVGGCASYAWVKPDASPALAASDARLCRAEVLSDPGWTPSTWTPGPPWHRPWVGAPGAIGPDVSWQLAAEQLGVDRCMRARGYDLVRVDRAR